MIGAWINVRQSLIYRVKKNMNYLICFTFLVRFKIVLCFLWGFKSQGSKINGGCGGREREIFNKGL